MSEIEWAEPPANGRSDWSATAEQLRANPGRWARVKTNASASTARHIKTGQMRAFRPAGAFEAKSSVTDHKGKFDIYARFVGEVTQ